MILSTLPLPILIPSFFQVGGNTTISPTKCSQTSHAIFYSMQTGTEIILEEEVQVGKFNQETWEGENFVEKNLEPKFWPGKFRMKTWSS